VRHLGEVVTVDGNHRKRIPVGDERDLVPGRVAARPLGWRGRLGRMTVRATVALALGMVAVGAVGCGGSTKTATHEYSGSGPKNLGDITVARKSTLKWTNDGPYFGILTTPIGSELGTSVPKIVSSYGHSGTTVLEKGTYERSFVNAVGNWTIKIVPR
jgi:hypothetical protein